MPEAIVDSEQGHQPASSPDGAGGQWAEKAQSTPEAPLDTTVGSFLFPPRNYGPNVVGDYIKFWETVPISDRVLSNLVSVYRANREEWLGAGLDRWASIDGNSVETAEWLRKKKPDSNQIRDRHNAARLVELRRLEAERPIKEIVAMGARTVAIAAQMYRCSGWMSDEDQRTIEERAMPLSAHRGWTVRQIWDEYHLGDIVPRALVDQDLAVAVELRELRKHFGAVAVI